MSSKRWVDGLFRERLEHRKFPVEDGEYEAMRTLLEARNAVRPTRAVGKVSAWWFGALLPVAAVVWWSTSENGHAAELRAEGEGRTHVPANDAGATKKPYPIAANKAPGITDAEFLNAAGSKGAQGSLPYSGSVTGGMNNSGLVSAISAMQPSAWDDKAGPTRSSALHSSGSLRVPESEQLHTEDAEGEHVSAGASTRETIGFLNTRLSLNTKALVALPVRREMEGPRRRSMGELHVFGAPLSVKTAQGSGSDGAIGSGSLYGLEYRVRSKYVSLATGIHYGTYGMQAGEGAADVKLNYVEVPLLAGAEVGFKRFGVLVQGGMSLDFLFDSGGRYPMEGARSGSGFPDDAFNTLNYSWILRPQVAYRWNERLSLSAGPLWKAQLGSVAQTGLLKDARSSSAGFTAGLTWRLDRSTF